MRCGKSDDSDLGQAREACVQARPREVEPLERSGPRRRDEEIRAPEALEELGRALAAP